MPIKIFSKRHTWPHGCKINQHTHTSVFVSLRGPSTDTIINVATVPVPTLKSNESNFHLSNQTFCLFVVFFFLNRSIFPKIKAAFFFSKVFFFLPHEGPAKFPHKVEPVWYLSPCDDNIWFPLRQKNLPTYTHTHFIARAFFSWEENKWPIFIAVYAVNTSSKWGRGWNRSARAAKPWTQGARHWPAIWFT